MNAELMAAMLKGMGHPISPPGCTSDFIDHPTRRDKAVEIGVVLQHRFAFFYWLRWHAERKPSHPPPNLLTIDWHDDVGGDCDFTPDEIKQLNPKDENELSLFCWAGLRSLNDGQIAPAQYLNAVGDPRGGILGDALGAEDALKNQDQGVTFFEFLKFIQSPQQQDRLRDIIGQLTCMRELTDQTEGLETIRESTGLFGNRTLGALLHDEPPEGLIDVLGYIQIACEDGHQVRTDAIEEVILPDGDLGLTVLSIPLVTFVAGVV